MLGGTEILIIGGAIVAVCFGPKILMSWGRGAGASIREYRKLKEEFTKPIDDGDTTGTAKRTGGDVKAIKGN